MKFILPLILYFTLPGFGQNMDEDLTDLNDVSVAKTYGYVNGIRLDSIDAAYGEFGRYGFNGLYFDYGQKRERRRELMITDQIGRRLVFDPFSNPVFLNFFDFNGWQLDKAVSDKNGSIGIIILKKK